jgi:hypothetical protein
MLRPTWSRPRAGSLRTARRGAATKLLIPSQANSGGSAPLTTNQRESRQPLPRAGGFSFRITQVKKVFVTQYYPQCETHPGGTPGLTSGRYCNIMWVSQQKQRPLCRPTSQEYRGGKDCKLTSPARRQGWGGYFHYWAFLPTSHRYLPYGTTMVSADAPRRACANGAAD